MSWNNILPWWVLIKEINFKNALEAGAFTNELHVSEMRGDYIY